MNSDFYCCKCGKKGIPIYRRKGREREAGHLKKLYCLNCNKEINHVECKENSKYDYHNFLEEFYGNNFTEEGKRILPYGLFKDQEIRLKNWDNIQTIVNEKEGDKV